MHLFIPGWGNIDPEIEWKVTDMGTDPASVGAKLTKGKAIP